MRTVVQTPSETFDAFGDPAAALPASGLVGSARRIGAVTFWVVAGLLVAGRFFVAVPPFDRASAPAAATTVAQAQGTSLR